MHKGLIAKTSITIHAPRAQVWQALVTPAAIQHYMFGTQVASDWREVRVELPLSVRTRNYVGTIFGGSMFGAVDPFYMIMLMKNLGPGYLVWDKAASIEFLKPGRSTLRATFRLDEAELEAIRGPLAAGPQAAGAR